MKSTVLEEDAKYVWHPFTQMQTAGSPLSIVKAKDATLYTEDGRSYLDCNSSWWVNTHGHGNEYIKEAIVRQFEAIDHTIFAGATHPKAVELSRRIAELLPGDLNKVFFSDDGSTAIEVALKMCIQYWYNKDRPKTKVLALDGAYHGDTFGAMSIGQRGAFNRPFEQLFFDVDFLPFPSSEKEEEVLELARCYFETGDFACLIVEPLVQGSAGMRMYRADFLEKLFQLARKNGVLIICDEIMTGWGRTGMMFALNYIETVPDIVCLSKGLTAGVLPLGLTVATEQIYNAFLAPEKVKALLHGHSYTGNPLACAAACANLDLTEQPGFMENIQRVSANHRRFTELLERSQGIKETRMLGTIIAIEMEIPSGVSSYYSELADKASAFFLEKGLLIRPLGNIIFLNPPYCITDEELEYVYQVIQSFIAQCVA